MSLCYDRFELCGRSAGWLSLRDPGNVFSDMRADLPTDARTHEAFHVDHPRRGGAGATFSNVVVLLSGMTNARRGRGGRGRLLRLDPRCLVIGYRDLVSSSSKAVTAGSRRPTATCARTGYETGRRRFGSGRLPRAAG